MNMQSKLLKHQIMNNEISIDYDNVGELLSKKVNENPNKKFLICPGKKTDEFTYGEFNKIVEKSIKFLQSFGLKKGEMISLIFYNSPEFLVLYFA